MSEAEIQKKIIVRHRKAGYFVTKIIQTSTNGIPDLLIIKNCRVAFVEVKREGAKCTPIQTYIQDVILSHAVEVYVTHDPDFFLEHINV